MRKARALWIRFAGLFNKSRLDKEIAEEIESHLQMHIEENLRSGMTPDEARRQARLMLGGVERVKEEWRDRATAPVIEHLVRDLCFSIRRLRSAPAFTATAILVLTLGMCATLAIFAFVDAALLKPLPYLDPSRLVVPTERTEQFPRANLSYQNYLDWKRLNTTLETLDAFRGDGFVVEAPSGAEPARAAVVTHGFFRTLGISPLLGRYFSTGEETASQRGVVLSYEAWITRYASRKDIIGERVTLSGQPFTIIGVLPPDFRFAPVGAAEFWTTVDPAEECARRRSCHNLTGLARLKPGVSIESAQANLAAIARHLEEQYPDANRGQRAIVLPLSELIAGEFRSILLTLLGGAGLLFTIACVNAASLVLVRSETRRREFAVRAALGASVGRLSNQFLTEALLVVLAAGGLAFVGARWAIQGITLLVPASMLPSMPFLRDAGWDVRLLGFAVAITCIALIAFSAPPALHLAVSKMRYGLTEGSRGSTGHAWRRLGARLVTVELALSMVLLVGAALFGKSLYRLLHVRLGFKADRLATIIVSAPEGRYNSPDKQRQLGRDIVAKLETIPGVESAALTSVLPVSYNGNTDWIRFVGKPYDGNHIEVNERDVSANFFETIGARLLRGRYFTEGEDGSKTKAVIINQTLADRYFPGEDPIGRQIGDTELSPKSLWTIVGVVDDIRDASLDSETWPAEYHPFNQDPNSYFSVVVRTSVKPEAVLPEMRRAIREVHPDAGTGSEVTMESRIDNSMAAYVRRSSAWLVGGFAGIALLLGLVGLYGVTAYSVSQRRREIGVRMALGAERSPVSRMILAEAGRLVTTGIILGVLASIAAAKLAGALLFGVTAWDASTLIGVAAMLGLATAAASIVPAYRAATVDPVEVLRSE